MGIALETRLQIYDYLLAKDLQVFNPVLGRGFSQFRVLLNASYQIRREIMRFSLLKRRLNFDLTGGLHRFRTGAVSDELEANISWLERFNREEKGPVACIRIFMNCPTRGNLQDGARVTEFRGDRWYRLCSVLPPSRSLGLQVPENNCGTPPGRCAHIEVRELGILETCATSPNLEWILGIMNSIEGLRKLDLWLGGMGIKWRCFKTKESMKKYLKEKRKGDLSSILARIKRSRPSSRSELASALTLEYNYSGGDWRFHKSAGDWETYDSAGDENNGDSMAEATNDGKED